MRYILYTLMFISCNAAIAECQPSIDEELADLFKGSISEAKDAAHCISISEHLAYGSSPIHVKVIVGDPDHIDRENNEIDFYYKTMAGPYWFAFVNGELIKQSLILPGRWRGTNNELQELWNTRRSSKYWYMWEEPANKRL